jgi:hypothetical protein
MAPVLHGDSGDVRRIIVIYLPEIGMISQITLCMFVVFCMYIIELGYSGDTVPFFYLPPLEQQEFLLVQACGLNQPRLGGFFDKNKRA